MRVLVLTLLTFKKVKLIFGHPVKQNKKQKNKIKQNKKKNTRQVLHRTKTYIMCTKLNKHIIRRHESKLFVKKGQLNCKALSPTLKQWM